MKNSNEKMDSSGINFEESIKDFAKRGFSRSETARILGISYRKLCDILEFIPGVEWAPNGQTLGNREAIARMKGQRSEARLRAIANAQAIRRQLHALDAFGVSDSLTNLWRRFSPPDLPFRTVKARFYIQKWPLEKALTHPKVRPHGQPGLPRDRKTNKWMKRESRMILEAFDAYCRRKGITSRQFQEEIFPHWSAAFIEGQKSLRQSHKEETFHYETNRKGNPR